MLPRRQFLKSSLLSGISYLTLSSASEFFTCADERTPLEQSPYSLSRDVPTRLFDGERCWCHPRAGIVPRAGEGESPRVVMTMNTLQLTGSDVFKGMFGMRTDDLGKTWTEPRELPPLAPRYQVIDGIRRPVAASDFWPCWHAKSRTLLGTGHTVVYTPDWKVTHPRPRHTSYSVYDPENDTWAEWTTLEMPDAELFHDSGAGCSQRYDEPDGSILLPIYYRAHGRNSRVTVTRCTFDGKRLKFEERGNDLHIDDKTRGLGEPSLTKFGDEYFLTLRNDRRGFVSRSRDGLQFEPIQPWLFDDGTDLGNYNTQQHWVTHSERLFLVYTRRGANNDHVFRHRAPLFMAEVDPRTLRVRRKTEQILVTERGARLGNFGVTHVSPEETWVTVAEWMQPKGVEKYGSDGSVFVARLHWKQPNRNLS